MEQEGSEIAASRMAERRSIDHDALRRSLAGRCFICGLVSRDPEFAHSIIYEDDIAIAFLSKYPTVRGYTLVAPRSHREQVTADFSSDHYLALQRVIYRVSEAIRRSVPTERLYILSLGSQQSNRHVHWHLVPLPPGVPFEQQQYAVLDRKDYLSFSDDETTHLVDRIRNELKVARSE
jgi:diadenosine tetraphosphate (Ap4A) HIT family hydrolase